MTKSVKLRPKIGKFFDLIAAKREGESLTEGEIMAATGWEKSTLDTHRNKNALDPFLVHLGGGQFRVRRSGMSISKEEIAKAFTQIRPTELILDAGTRLKSKDSEYQLVEELGRGAVAHVWRARRASSGQDVAVKVVSPRPDLLEPSTLDNVKHRFSREARHGIRISHPNIVTYLDFGEIKGHPFLVMDLADSSLGKLLSAGPFSLERSLAVIECCTKGLMQLHGENCVHRDVKPPNILQFGERFVLGDLGIVKWSDLNPAFTSAGTITKAAVHLGSWFYMAPEQRREPHEATAASDIYALGISWYEILTGRTPDPAEVAAQDFDNPSDVETANQLIRRALKYRPQERPTASDVLRTIEEIRSALTSGR